jgi:hypothetical protein
MWIFAIFRVKIFESKLIIHSASFQKLHDFLRNFERKQCGVWQFSVQKILKSLEKYHSIYTNSSFFSQNFLAKFMWLLAILHVKNNNVKHENTYQ